MDHPPLPTDRARRRVLLGTAGAAALGAAGTAPRSALAETWKPSRTIEFVVPSGPGAALDAAAREISTLMERGKLVDETIVVNNRSGGAGTIALQTLLQHPGDGHKIGTFTTGMINARAIGELSVSYVEVTQIAILLEEAVAVAVRADSPLRSARDLVERLGREADGLSIGIATAVGNHIHVGIAKPLQVAGVDVARLRMVPFRSSADSMTALLGGHIDVVAASTPNVTTQLAAGKIRVLAVATEQRLEGGLAGVPTWIEQGVAASYSSFQGVLGAKGMTAAQVAFWEVALRKASDTDAWRAFLAKQHWRPRFLVGDAMRRYVEAEYASTREILGQLKLLKS